MLETPPKLLNTRLRVAQGTANTDQVSASSSENLKDMGTISRKGSSEMMRILRDYTFGEYMTTKLNAEWVVGFVDGEGCFHIALNTNTDMKLGVQVLPEFTVVQHQSDVQILYALKAYWQCGVVRVNHGDRMCYRVRGHRHLQDIIVPFFENHKLKTKKRIAFEKFRDVVRMMDHGEHLTETGIHAITKIRDGMNTLRESPPFHENGETM